MTPELLSCPACDRVTALMAAVRPNAKLRCPHCGREFYYSELPHEMEVCWEVLEDQQEFPAGVGSKTIDQAAELSGSRTVNLIDPSAQTLVDLLGEYEGLELEPPTDNHHPAQLPTDEQPTDEQLADEQLTDEPSTDLQPTDEQLTGFGADEAEELSAPHDYSNKESVALAANESNQSAVPAKKAEWTGFQPLTPELYERRRRKSHPSPLWTVLQIALGGLAAIPISLLLVWHVIGSDVGEAGKWVGKYLPIIVPEDLRGTQPSALSEASGRGGDELSNMSSAGNGSQNSADTAKASHDQEVVASSDIPLREQAADGSLPLDDTTDPTSGAVSPPAAPIPEWDEATQPVTAPTATELNARLLENTFAMIRQASDHLEDWSAAARKEDIDLRSLAQATYRDLTNLALVIDKLPPENQVLQAVRRQLQPLGRQVAADTEIQRLILGGARYWVGTQSLRAAQAPNETQAEPSVAAISAKAPDSRYGLAMIVVVEAAEEVVSDEGQWWNVVAYTDSRLGEPPLEIRIPQDVAMSLAKRQIVPQQSLFLLGGVRRVAEESDSQTDSAPDRPVFVASYGVGL